jgi:hypothetical protein
VERKDYRALAAALAAVRPTPNQHAQYTRWVLCRNAIGRVLRADNPAFEEWRFDQACAAESASQAVSG